MWATVMFLLSFVPLFLSTFPPFLCDVNARLSSFGLDERIENKKRFDTFRPDSRHPILYRKEMSQESQSQLDVKPARCPVRSLSSSSSLRTLYLCRALLFSLPNHYVLMLLPGQLHPT